MRGDQAKPRRVLAVGQRQAGFRRATERSRDARNDGRRNPGRTQSLQFLAAAAENEGIAALEPDDLTSGARRRDQMPVDRLLADAGMTSALADIDRSASGRANARISGSTRSSMENDIGRLQQTQCAHSQEIGIARPGADQIDT